MPSAGFEPAIPAIERAHTYALDRMATRPIPSSLHFVMTVTFAPLILSQMTEYSTLNTRSTKREDQQDATIRCLLLTSVSTCFGHNDARNMLRQKLIINI